MSCTDCTSNDKYELVNQPPPEHYWHPNGAKGFWSVVKPLGVEVTNEAENPSAEYDLTNWIALTGTVTLTRNAASAMHGGNGVGVTTTVGGTGVGYDMTSIAALNTSYCACITIRGDAGIAEFDIVWPGAPTPDPVVITLTGQPQRVCYTLPPQSAGPTFPAIFVRVLFSNPGDHAVDGLTLVTEGQCLAEYFDGDSPGASWDGTPHASPSTMGRFSRAYGNVIDLNEIGFNVISADGWGLAPYNNIVTSFARGNGAHLQRQQLAPRTISLVGQIVGGRLGMHNVRRELIAAMNYRFKGQCTQELLLRYQLRDDCGCQLSTVVEIPAVYAAGLEGSWSNLESERAIIQFQAHREVNWVSPFEHAAALTAAGTGEVDETYIRSVTYEGDEDAWVTIELRGGTGSGLRVASIENMTTDAIIQFIDPVTPANEYIAVNDDTYVIIRTDPRALDITTYPTAVRWMNRLRYPGSQMTAMRLVPGVNNFRTTVPLNGDDAVVVMHWHDHYSSTDVIPMCDACTENYL